MPDHTAVVVRKRIVFVLFALSLVMFALVCRLFYLQVIRNEWLRQMALDQRYATLYEDSRRGPIYDVRFRKLAVSMSAESIVAIPAQISDARDTAAKLSEVLDMDYQSVYAKLTQPLASVHKTAVDQRQLKLSKS